MTPLNTEEKKYQQYTCSRSSTQMITTSGKKFSFIDHRLITDDLEIINFLDAEIAAGLNVVTNAGSVTAKEADPMETLKAKIIAEYEQNRAEEAKQAALGISRDMGNTAQATSVNPVSSNGTACSMPAKAVALNEALTKLRAAESSGKE